MSIISKIKRELGLTKKRRTHKKRHHRKHHARRTKSGRFAKRR